MPQAVSIPVPVDQTHAPALRALVDQVQEAASRKAVLAIRGHGSKDFLGVGRADEALETRTWRGIEQYEPSELVVRVRGGTPLAELEAALAAQRQYLAFEPPRWTFGLRDPVAGPTVGGMVAAGFSGPGRVSRGAVRDHVLGATVLTGRGEVLSFGGAVMKNVAGFDLSRLMAGSLGTLGVIVDVTLKVVPMPTATATLRLEMPEAEAVQEVNRLAGQPLPLDASAWWDGMLVLRLRGAQAAVQAAVTRLAQDRGAELIDAPVAEAFWQGLRDQRDEFFTRARAAVVAAGDRGVCLWRLSLPPTAAPLNLPGEQLHEWFGAQRWLCTPVPAPAVREAALRAGGHAQAFLSRMGLPLNDTSGWTPVMRRLHERVQVAFDPQGVFNTGRLGAIAGAGAPSPSTS